MPIYGYRCGSCGHEFEVLQKMSDKPPKTCPKCAGSLTKIQYAAGVIYKGSGYYKTDYKSGGSSSSSDSSNGSSESPGSDKTSEGAGESKATSETKPESTASKSDSSTEKAP